MYDINDQYYICFIDLLGQKEFFKGVKSSKIAPETLENIERVAFGLRESVRYVKGRYTRLFCRDDDVGLELFSDSILLSMRATERNFSKLKDFLDIIVKLVFIVSKYKLPVRGCITRGRAARSDSGAIYGTAVMEAGELESRQADYPRILISHTLVEDFTNAELLSPYITRDVDSLWVLDYAGNFIMSRLEFAKEAKQLDEMREWVTDCYHHYCFLEDKDHNQHANPILARKYVMWLDYLSRTGKHAYYDV